MMDERRKTGYLPRKTRRKERNVTRTRAEGEITTEGGVCRTPWTAAMRAVIASPSLLRGFVASSLPCLLDSLAPTLPPNALTSARLKVKGHEGQGTGIESDS